MRRNETADAEAGDGTQKLLADLEALDRESAQATTPEEQARLTNRRADLLETDRRGRENARGTRHVAAAACRHDQRRGADRASVPTGRIV